MYVDAHSQVHWHLDAVCFFDLDSYFKKYIPFLLENVLGYLCFYSAKVAINSGIKQTSYLTLVCSKVDLWVFLAFFISLKHVSRYSFRISTVYTLVMTCVKYLYWWQQASMNSVSMKRIVFWRVSNQFYNSVRMNIDILMNIAYQNGQVKSRRFYCHCQAIYW